WIRLSRLLGRCGTHAQYAGARQRGEKSSSHVLRFVSSEMTLRCDKPCCCAHESSASDENRPRASAAKARGPSTTYRDGAAYCVSSLRMILPPFITNLTR